MGSRRVEGDRITRSELVFLEPEADAEPSLEYHAVLASRVAHHPFIGGRRTTHAVHDVEEVDVLMLVARQPLPAHAGVEVDHVPILHTHHRTVIGDLGSVSGALASWFKSGAVRPSEDVVDRDAELGHDPVERAHGRLGLAALDLRDHAGRQSDPSGEFALTDPHAVSLLTEPGPDVFQLAGHQHLDASSPTAIGRSETTR